MQQNKTQTSNSNIAIKTEFKLTYINLVIETQIHRKSCDHDTLRCHIREQRCSIDPHVPLNQVQAVAV